MTDETWQPIKPMQLLETYALMQISEFYTILLSEGGQDFKDNNNRYGAFFEHTDLSVPRIYDAIDLERFVQQGGADYLNFNSEGNPKYFEFDVLDRISRKGAQFNPPAQLAPLFQTILKDGARNNFPLTVFKRDNPYGGHIGNDFNLYEVWTRIDFTEEFTKRISEVVGNNYLER